MKTNQTPHVQTPIRTDTPVKEEQIRVVTPKIATPVPDEIPAESHRKMSAEETVIENGMQQITIKNYISDAVTAPNADESQENNNPSDVVAKTEEPIEVKTNEDETKLNIETKENEE